MDPKPENLFQYALMGTLYARTVFGLENPRVGLLNVGVESEKGNELAKQTYGLLAQSELNFIGNVEAREVLEGRCDVLICDGFVGNVLLKSMEGVAYTLFSQMKEAVRKGGVKGKVGALLLKDTLKALKDKMDYSKYLLGINGVCIKCHGSADAGNVKNAILNQAYVLVKEQTIASMTKIMGE
jgi:glycerol-3-phosphate acyltransferase PlsX